MIYPLSELVDRYSILCLKKERTKNSKKIDAECERFRLAILAGVGTWVWYPTVIRKMKVINGKIWDLESDIRKGKEKELGLEEVGRRANF